MILSSPSVDKVDLVSSRISPCLIDLVYPLGYYIVIPLYLGQIEITGRENIPLTGPVIVAPTHRSRWDALIVPLAVGKFASGRHLRFMVTENEVQGFQGWWIRRLGGFPVNTERPGSGSLVHCVELLQQGEMVVIFPEGGIFRDNRVHPLKRGVARLALEVATQKPDSNIKILPISVKYSQPYPSWKTKIEVNIGTPIEVSQYEGKSIKTRSSQLTTDLKASLKAIHEEPETLTAIATVQFS